MPRQLPMPGPVTRRAALASGAGLAGAVLLRQVPAAAALSPGVPAAAAGRLVIGADEGWFSPVHHAVPTVTCRRAYFNSYDYIPARWPATAGAATQSASIRPVPSSLLSGRLDARLRAFIRSAPPGSFLTAWHEAGNLIGYPAYINPPNMRAVHRHMHRLCRGTHVSYGPILCMRPESMPPWLVPGMDWYGLDIYDWPQFHHPRGPLDVRGRLWPRLNQWKAVIRHVSGRRNPALAICETNSLHPANRPSWLLGVAEWMARDGGARMLTFWRRGGVGPWLPHDRAVISALRQCARL